MLRVLTASALIVAGGLACSCVVPLLALLAGTGAGVWLTRWVDPLSGLWLGSVIAVLVGGFVWLVRSGRLRRGADLRSGSPRAG